MTGTNIIWVMGTNIISKWTHTCAANLAVQADDGRLNRVAGNLQNNAVPHWNDTDKQLVTGTIFDNGNIGIGTAGPGDNLTL